MLGRLRAGPASSRASAGPLPMPLPNKPWMMGTSVSVAKYMKAPPSAAKKLAATELPPTMVDDPFRRHDALMARAPEQEARDKHPA